MNVLYVTNNSICIDPLFFHGEDICRGLPSQFHVLRAMGERGDKVDFVIAHEYQQPEIDIKCDWLMRSEIKLIDKGKRDYLSKVMFYAGGIIKKATEEMLAKKRYDFVYLHNAIAAPASGAAIRAGIPCGQRVYGSFYPRDLREKGKIYCTFKYPQEIYMIKSKKTFLLATNDGSRLDTVVSGLYGDNPPYDFFEWDNGVEESYDDRILSRIPSKPFLLCAARIDPWKHQDRGIIILYQMLQQGVDCNLVLAGATYNSAYEQNMKDRIEVMGLQDRVLFLGPLTQPEVMSLDKHALANLFLYDYSNRGNSFLEAVRAGGLCVVPDWDISVRDIIEDGVTGITVSDDIDAAEKIKKMIKAPEEAKSMKALVCQRALDILPTWDERVRKELDLIDSYC